MDINFDEYIEKKVKFYQNLSRVTINTEQYSLPVTLSNTLFKDINTDFSYFIARRKQKERLKAVEGREFREKLLHRFPLFSEIRDCSNPAIYWFKIKHLEKSNNKSLLKRFVKTRNPKNGWWSKPRKDIENMTEYLYLGKVEKNLFDRFTQHLGFGHRMTSSLKLSQWIDKIDDIELEFQFLQLDTSEISYLQDIENVLWRKFDPLLGAEPHIK